jgi:hypothetical protein
MVTKLNDEWTSYGSLKREASLGFKPLSLSIFGSIEIDQNPRKPRQKKRPSKMDNSGHVLTLLSKQRKGARIALLHVYVVPDAQIRILKISDLSSIMGERPVVASAERVEQLRTLAEQWSSKERATIIASIKPVRALPVKSSIGSPSLLAASPPLRAQLVFPFGFGC